MVATSATTATGAPGSTVSFQFQLTDPGGGCSSANGTITLTSDGTGGATLVNPASGVWSGVNNSLIDIDVQLGNTGSASVTVNANCSNCASFVANTIPFTGTTTASVFTLDVVAPTGGAISIYPGDSVPVTVQAMQNGSPYTTPVLVGFTSAPSGLTHPASATTSATDGTANISVTTTTALAPGDYVLTASYCPFGPPCTPVSNTVTVHVIDARIEVEQGDNQNGPANSVLPTTLMAFVSDDFVGVDGITVNWSVAGAATLDTNSNVTAGGGNAEVTVTLGNAPGTTVQVTATRMDTGASVVFNLSIDDEYTLTATTATSFNVGLGEVVNLGVRYELNGNPNSSTVNWAAPLGGTLGTTSTTGDTNGDSSNTFSAAAAGTYTVTADGTCAPGPGCPPSTLTYTIQVVNQTLVAVSNSNPEAYPSGGTSTLVAAAFDDGLNAVGETINWSVVSGDATVTTSSVTDGAGQATATVTYGTAVGPIVVRAARADAPTVTADFNLAIVLPQLTIVSGDNQTGVSGSLAPAPMVVQLNDGMTGNNPVNGATINWAAISGGATPTSATSITDGAGQASMTFTFGTGGVATISATEGLTGLVSQSFTSTATAPTLLMIQGDGQTGDTGTTLPIHLVVEAQDNGIAAPGVTINWSVVSGDASVNVITNPTNAGGQSSAQVTFGTTPGVVTVQAQRADAPTIVQTFTLNSTLVRTLALTSGDGQSAYVNTALGAPLVVTAQDNGLAAPGVTINWAVTSGNVTITPSGATDASGQASATITTTATTGAWTVTATRADEPTATVTFSGSTILATLSPFSGGGQTGATGTTLPQPFRFKAFDDGLAAAGVGITWSVVGDATLANVQTTTDVNGLVSADVVLGSTPGTVTVTAQRNDVPTVTASIVATATLTRTLAPVSGDNQSGPTGTAAPLPLVVEARDNGLGAGGVTINWVVVSGDATVTPGGPTDVNGIAQATVTFGATAGPIQISATRADEPTATTTFNLTAISRGLIILGGNNQSGPTGAALPASMFVRSELNGSPEAGVDLDWTVTSGDGTVNVLVDPTNAGGTGSAQAVCGATAGALVITASRVDDPSVSVVFSHACSLTRELFVHDGDNQTGATGSTLPLNLVVEAKDNGIGVDGVPIAFTVISGDATVGCCGTTAGGGFAGVPLTFGSTPGPVQVRAERTDDPSVFVIFNATAVARGLVILGGDNQTGSANTALPSSLFVRSELGGVAEPGVDLDWVVTSGDATVNVLVDPTNASGTGSAQVTCGPTGGPVTVTVSRVDTPSISVVFSATCTVTPTLVIGGGDGQVSGANQAFAAPLVVVAQNSGTAASGVTINWIVTSGDATVTPSSVTDATGHASATVTAGATAGPVVITATRADAPAATVTFNLAIAQPTLTIVSGNNQTGYPNQPGTAPLVVELRDGTPANNPVVGQTIFWDIVAGGVFLAGPSSVTNVNGRAAMNFTYGGAGFTDIKAHDGGALAVQFTVQALQPTLAIASGDGQTAAPNTAFAAPLVVHAQDEGVSVAGVTINWTVTSGSATVASGSSVTDGAGLASIGLTAGGTPGPVTVTAVRADNPTVSVTFNATVSPFPVLSIVSGNNQEGLTSTVADDPLVVLLTDGSGNPIAGQTITWTIGGPGTLSQTSTPTDATGHAQVTLTFGATSGAITVSASTTGGATPVNFSATSLDAALGIASGDNQSGPVNTMLPLPLVVAVVDPSAGGKIGGGMGRQALDGVPVTFTVTSGGGSVTQTVVMTDASGQASTQWTLGPVPGAQTVSASVSGGASVTFNATAILNRTLTIVSGNGQTSAPGSTLPNPLVVHAQDDGVDAAGVGINWSVVSGSATVAPPNNTTDANGLAQSTVTLGTSTGTVQIRAERADDPAVFVTFAATTAKLSLLPGLTPDELELAIVIDEACETLAGMSSLTPPQQDLLARCQELIDSSVIDPDATIDALDELLPGLAGAMAESAFNAAQSQFDNLKARIAALRSGTQGNGFQGLALSAPGGTVSLGGLVNALTQDGEAEQPTGEVGGGFQRWGFFASGTIGRGEAEEGSTRPAYDYDINGLTVGVDYRKSDTLIFGAALGYTRQDTDLVGRDGRMDMSGWSISGYGTWYRANSWYTDAVVSWGRNTFDLLRTITYTVPLPGGGTSVIDQTARSQSDGDMLEAAFTFGRDFQKGGWSIGPYGRLMYTKLSFDEIVDEMEPGAGSGLGLEIESRSLTSVASEIGAKFTYAHSTDWGVVTPHFQIEWEHEFKDDPKAMTARFLADPNGTPFTLAGEDIDADYFRVSLGLSIILSRGRSGFLLYEKTVGREGFDQDNFGFGLRIEF